MWGYTMKATVAPTAKARTEITTRRRSSARCSPSVMASGVGRLNRLRNGTRGRATIAALGGAGQFMLGSSGTTGWAPGTAEPAAAGGPTDGAVPLPALPLVGAGVV